jgi:hypothetical protein
MAFKLNYIGIAGFAAVVIGLAGSFLNWIQFGTTGETGLETLFQDGGTYTLYAVAIFVALICDAIFLAVNFAGKGIKRINFLFVILSALLLMSALLIFFDAERDAVIGLFLEMAAGVILFIVSVYFALKRP